MSTTRQEPELWPAVVWFAPALLLVIAVGNMPGGYYTFLHVAVCLTSIALVIHDIDLRDNLSGWAILLVLLAVLFNPLFPVPLTRAEWAFIELGSAVFLLVHDASCRRFARVRKAGSGTRIILPPVQPPRPKPGRTHTNALAPKTRLKEYEIVRQLGAGSFGITYLAFDHNLNGPVALKEYFYAGQTTRRSDGSVAPISTERTGDYEWGRARFVEEAQVLTRLEHRNIVRARRFFEANNTAYIVMDYVEGDPLSVFLERHVTLTPTQWQAWLDPLLDGLEHVHDNNYLHRDIKPDNIVIRADATGASQPVVIDFGAARRAAADKTQSLTAVLTPRYAPIEQYSSTSRQGPPTDIYSLAAVSYRVLTGEPPPDAADRVNDDGFRPLAQRLHNPAGHPLLSAIDAALAVHAAHRPQTVQEWRRLMRKRSNKPADDIRPGMRVRHREFGVGTVVNVETIGGDVKLQVRFKTVGVKTNLRLKTDPPSPQPIVPVKPPQPTRERRTLHVRQVGSETTSARGNRYVVCETNHGKVAFWGPDNIRRVLAADTPFVVTCDCVLPSGPGEHDLWVSETSYVGIQEPAAADPHDIPFWRR